MKFPAEDFVTKFQYYCSTTTVLLGRRAMAKFCNNFSAKNWKLIDFSLSLSFYAGQAISISVWPANLKIYKVFSSKLQNVFLWLCSMQGEVAVCDRGLFTSEIFIYIGDFLFTSEIFYIHRSLLFTSKIFIYIRDFIYIKDIYIRDFLFTSEVH